MPGRMPNRFDIIYAHGVDEKDKEDCIGYVMDIRENERKSKNVVNGMGLPAFTPRSFTIKFLNKEAKLYEEEQIIKFISDKKWASVEPTPLPNLDKPRYETGDLIFNKKNQKVSLIIGVVDSKSGHEQKLDAQTQQHSQFWYKVQSPGQRWEPLSETFIEHGIEKEFVAVHKRKHSTTEQVPN